MYIYIIYLSWSMNKILYYEILRIRKCQPVFLLDDFPGLLLVRAQHRGHQNLCVPIVMFNSLIMSIARFQSFASFPLSLHVFHIFWPLPYHNFQSKNVALWPSLLEPKHLQLQHCECLGTTQRLRRENPRNLSGAKGKCTVFLNEPWWNHC